MPIFMVFYKNFTFTKNDKHVSRTKFLNNNTYPSRLFRLFRENLTFTKNYKHIFRKEFLNNNTYPFRLLPNKNLLKLVMKLQFRFENGLKIIHLYNCFYRVGIANVGKSSSALLFLLFSYFLFLPFFFS